MTERAQILKGDAGAVLATLPDESVHCVVTSPPYWGLRDYGIEGQIGLEKTPEEYVSKMVAVCREIRRVLRSDGTFWLNLGDSFGTGSGGDRKIGVMDETRARARMQCPGLKPKDLCGIPWTLALALRDDGWWLRRDIIWAKPNPMPESCTDRCTSSHEYLFHLTKSAKYFYDQEAIKEPSATPSTFHGGGDVDDSRNDAGRRNEGEDTGSRNKRSVWTIATQPYPEAHFATFPEKLVEPCILAGTSERGCCPECGAPWARVVEGKGGNWEERKMAGAPMRYGLSGTKGTPINQMGDRKAITTTIGWRPPCECCNSYTWLLAPCVVLDPFMGSGTTGVVALKLNRHFIGIELSPEYVKLAWKRLKPHLQQEMLGL